MRDEMALLRIYQEEKATVIGPLAERTGLETFQTYAEWKKEYLAEYAEDHAGVVLTMEEAVDLTDKELDDTTTDPLEALAAEEDLNLLSDEEEDIMTETTDTTVAAEEAVPAKTTTKPVAKKPAKKAAAKPAAKKTTKKTAAKPAAKTTKKASAAPAKPSKAGEARKIFNRMYPKVLAGQKARKDVISEFVEKAELSKAGASTYYQNFKSKYEPAAG